MRWKQHPEAGNFSSPTDHTTTPIDRESSFFPHMGMGRLCWIWLILGWGYPYADICLVGNRCQRSSTTHVGGPGNVWIEQLPAANNII